MNDKFLKQLAIVKSLILKRCLNVKKLRVKNIHFCWLDTSLMILNFTKIKLIKKITKKYQNFAKSKKFSFE